MKLKPTCHEVHRLVSEGLDRKLSRIERARMSLHLMVCGICRTFSAQMRLMHRAMKQFVIQDAAPVDRPASKPLPPA